MKNILATSLCLLLIPFTIGKAIDAAPAADADTQAHAITADNELEPDTNFHSDANSHLSKRHGYRTVRAYQFSNCQDNQMIKELNNFGCGDHGCVNLRLPAGSGRVIQQAHGNPYPTMDVYEQADCVGNPMAHFGVKGVDSCTNVANPNKPFRSFRAYYDC